MYLVTGTHRLTPHDDLLAWGPVRVYWGGGEVVADVDDAYLFSLRREADKVAEAMSNFDGVIRVEVREV